MSIENAAQDASRYWARRSVRALVRLKDLIAGLSRFEEKLSMLAKAGGSQFTSEEIRMIRCYFCIQIGESVNFIRKRDPSLLGMKPLGSNQHGKRRLDLTDKASAFFSRLIFLRNELAHEEGSVPDSRLQAFCDTEAFELEERVDDAIFGLDFSKVPFSNLGQSAFLALGKCKDEISRRRAYRFHASCEQQIIAEGRKGDHGMTENGSRRGMDGRGQQGGGLKP